MPGPASTYADITREVEEIVQRHRYGNDPNVVRYMVGRAAFVGISASKGPENAGALAYSLGDELSTGSMKDG